MRLLKPSPITEKRKIWKPKFLKGSFPVWPCPHCGSLSLNLVPATLTDFENAGSRAGHRLEEWSYDWSTFSFNAWFKCGSTCCKQDVSVTGTVEIDEQYEGDAQYIKLYSPLFTVPTVEMFRVSPGCPDEVKSEIIASFSLYWSDTSSSANRLRVALEKLMDHAGVKIRKTNTEGEFHYFSLHQRIEEFAKKFPKIGKNLMAIKFLGNSGSHKGKSIPHEDILDGYHIVEHTLIAMFEKREETVARIATKLSKRHGWKAPKKQKTKSILATQTIKQSPPI